MSIKPKQKKCAGIGKAISYKGCGKETFNRKLGLCMKCYPDFIMNTEPGKLILEKSIIKGKQKVKTENSKQIKIQKDKTKIDLMTADKYRSKYLQPVINEISRLIDFGQPCIATDNFGKMNGGHYTSVAANRTICLNLHNIHIQSFESNHFKSGDNIKYRAGLIKKYGVQYYEFVENLKQHRTLKLTKSEMIEIHKNAVEIRNKLRKNERISSSFERILLRNALNVELGIYDKEFCLFEYYF